MDFNEFIDAVVDRIPEYLLQYDIENIHVDKIRKNNGVICTGMAIKVKEESVSPNIYLEYYYGLYRQGYDLEDILARLRDEYNEAKEKLQEEDYHQLIDYNIKDSIFLRLVNYDKNKELLQECPYINFMDLAITFRLLVKKDGQGIASALVRNKDMERWNLNQEQLYEYGLENTRVLFPPVMKSLFSMISELDPSFDLKDETGLTVLTNETGINGATSIIYKDIIKEFANKNNSDIYILPSSIHEVLLLPVNHDANQNELANMVREINEYVVCGQDFLSNNVYIFDMKKGCFRI